MTDPGRAVPGALRLLLLGWLLAAPAAAEILDEAAPDDVFLSALAPALDHHAIDVAHNLNHRDLAGGRITRPRLGRFPDLPLNALADSSEIEHWEAGYHAGEIGGLAILAESDMVSSGDDFLAQWLDAPASRRLFVSFHGDDAPVAARLVRVLGEQGHATWLSGDGANVVLAGNLYATAAQRLAIDSRSARRYRTEVTELDYLGRKVRRNSNSLFRAAHRYGARSLARREPAVFRKDTLGDEFSESTIREIIVPGGVALGESAELPFAVSKVRFDDGQMVLEDEQGNHWRLPAIEAATLKALFDFVQRSEATASDAIVDIDANRRVRISAALRDTDAGYAIMDADTRPFQYVSYLPVTKSVIVDTRVGWFAEPGNVLAFDTAYEVRFLSADNMRLAQTRVALEYQYHSVSGDSVYFDAWGRDSERLRESTDFAGLGNAMKPVADHAGWIALWRRLHGDGTPFLHGRYEFMKLDKTGRSTPARW